MYCSTSYETIHPKAIKRFVYLTSNCDSKQKHNLINVLLRLHRKHLSPIKVINMLSFSPRIDKFNSWILQNCLTCHQVNAETRPRYIRGRYALESRRVLSPNLFKHAKLLKNKNKDLNKPLILLSTYLKQDTGLFVWKC